MIMLGLDTSGYVNAVGLTDSDKILADASFDARTDSLEQIVDNIDGVLKSAGLTLDDVQGIGVGLGPGSWTGIRVGVTVGKMLAFSAGKPVAGIPTLETLAYSAGTNSLPVYAVISMGVGDNIYAARYRVADGNITLDGSYFTGGIDGLAELITEPCVIAASGAAAYADKISQKSDVKIQTIEAKPGGAATAILAARRLARGESDDTLTLAPLYLKESTARVFVNKYNPR